MGVGLSRGPKAESGGGVLGSEHFGCTNYSWFPPFRCRSAVAVSPLPLRKFRKNYVAYVKNSVAPLPFPPAVAP